MPNSIFNPHHQNDYLPAKIAAALERLGTVHDVLFREAAQATGLSPLQLRMLLFIAYHAPERANVTELAREFQLTKPTASDALRVLRQKDLLRKVPDGIDRRKHGLILTDTGRKIVEGADAIGQSFERLIAGRSAAEQETTYSLLAHLINQFLHNETLETQRICYQCRFYAVDDQGAHCQLLRQPLPPAAVRIDCPEWEEKG